MKQPNFYKIFVLGFAMLFLFSGCSLGTDPEKDISLVSKVENPVEADEDGYYSAESLGITKPDKIICYRDKKSVEFTPESAEFAALIKLYELVKDQRLGLIKTVYAIYSGQVGKIGEWIVFTYADSDKKIYFKLYKNDPNESNVLFVTNAPGADGCYGYDGDFSEFQTGQFFK